MSQRKREGGRERARARAISGECLGLGLHQTELRLEKAPGLAFQFCGLGGCGVRKLKALEWKRAQGGKFFYTLRTASDLINTEGSGFACG